MICVYKYIDLADDIVKYVGITYGDSSNLKKRIYQHRINDNWANISNYNIQYQDFDVNSRTDAEMLEAHYIALYQTYKYYNKDKKKWGLSSFIPNREHLWKEYKTERPYNKCDNCNIKQKYKILSDSYDQLKQSTAYDLLSITENYKEEKKENECLISMLVGWKSIYDCIKAKMNRCKKQEKIDLYSDLLSKIEHYYNTCLDFDKPDITISFDAYINEYEFMKGKKYE